MAVPAALPAAQRPQPALVAPAVHDTPAAAPTALDRAIPSEECLATTVCGLQNRVRWGTPAWSADYCRDVARAVVQSSRKYQISPSLLLAVMVNESDMNARAVRETERDGKLYAKDSGLMGIRCLVDGKGTCTNGHVRGMSWKSVMDPFTNIDLGARELAHWRTAGVARVTVRKRVGGVIETREKLVQCKHRTHAFWAHYNHGPVYIDHGPARHYPHRVAVIDYAIARAMNVEAPELTEVPRITIHDKGQRERTPDRPIEPRYRKLCSDIRGLGGMCSNVATLPAAQPKTISLN